MQIGSTPEGFTKTEQKARQPSENQGKKRRRLDEVFLW
jgi:hypothetical protein|tara:strand:- start:23 stop:136 length:114 start_codon:yes stop_codon:yes gene_type:complete